MSRRVEYSRNTRPWLLWAVLVALTLGMVGFAISSQGPVDSDILDQVREILNRVLSVPLPADETDVIESGLLDSLGLVELLVAIERQFDVQIDLEYLDLDDLRSVHAIARTIERVKGESATGESLPAGA